MNGLSVKVVQLVVFATLTVAVPVATLTAFAAGRSCPSFASQLVGQDGTMAIAVPSTLVAALDGAGPDTYAVGRTFGSPRSVPVEHLVVAAADDRLLDPDALAEMLAGTCEGRAGATVAPATVEQLAVSGADLSVMSARSDVGAGAAVPPVTVRSVDDALDATRADVRALMVVIALASGSIGLLVGVERDAVPRRIEVMIAAGAGVVAADWVLAAAAPSPAQLAVNPVRPGVVPTVVVAMAISGLALGGVHLLRRTSIPPTMPLIAAVVVTSAFAGMAWWLEDAVDRFGASYAEFSFVRAGESDPYGAVRMSAAELREAATDDELVYTNRFRFEVLDGKYVLVSGVDPDGFARLDYHYVERLPSADALDPCEAVVSTSFATRLGVSTGDDVGVTVGRGTDQCSPTVIGVFEDPTWRGGIVVLPIADYETGFGGSGWSRPMLASAVPRTPPAGFTTVDDFRSELAAAARRPERLVGVGMTVGVLGAMALALGHRKPLGEMTRYTRPLAVVAAGVTTVLVRVGLAAWTHIGAVVSAPPLAVVVVVLVVCLPAAAALSEGRR